MECDILCDSYSFNRPSPCKKRKKNKIKISIDEYFPYLRSSDYFTVPSIDKLVELEVKYPGYCSKVRDFTVGRLGFGNVRFLGDTDVRGLDLEGIVRFSRHEVVVYEDESVKPDVGEGLNKPAVVTLVLRVGGEGEGFDGVRFGKVVDRLRFSADRQGGEFVSFEPWSREWRFRVKHFSRFGLSLDDEDDIIMDDVGSGDDEVEMSGGGGRDDDEEEGEDGGDDDGFDVGIGTGLSHSLPAHLGLDPARMREMQMMMFGGDEDEEYDETPSREEKRLSREKFPLYNSGLKLSYKPSPPPPRKTPVPLLEYKSSNFDANAPGTLLLTQQNKGFPWRVAKSDGFRLESNHETPVSSYHSRNIVDAGLFMGRSFRVGWGPNGVLIHSGTPVSGNSSKGILSSVITVETVAIDKVARDENNEVKQDAVSLLFDSTLELHRSLDHSVEEIESGSFRLCLQKVLCDRFALSDICRCYTDVVEKQLDVVSLPAVHLSLMHQVYVWELIKVLFSEKDTSEQFGADDQEEEMMLDGKARSSEIDPEALPLIRRAEFSSWLQETVYHRVQDDVNCLDDSSDLEQILLLLTGRQLDAAVELAASRGDVRLACLLSEAGGSMVNRSDVGQQLDIWRINGMDFHFIEKDRVRLYELLSGNIHSAFSGESVDWKRFLGLLMWYELPPDTSLPAIFRTYQHLLTENKAPYPVPTYIDEGPIEVNVDVVKEGRFDLAYYLMLLHGNEDGKYDQLKSMFSAFASTDDPLDYHMIWHQRGILEAIGAFTSNDLHILDMAYVSQLLCVGKCHWAIYVVLHIPYREDFPYLHSNVIREILFQYCETWSSSDEQTKFIEDLGVPSQWLHEAMAVYFQYCGDSSKALEHYIKCESWQKAHSIFITSVVHSLFLSDKDSEIWRLATSMEDSKSGIEDWDLGAGIYISFYLLRSSLRGDDDDMTKLVTNEVKWVVFLVASFGEQKVSLVAYSKMSEEICSLLLSDSGEDSTREAQLSCYDTAATAPIPEDIRSCHLQDALSLFTCYLAEAAS
ncbi:hypothetical protein KSS87_020553 [Heliosperma pusillum]|nr:hypothetical protein KSS87_020553 [Heliosperma pusillum]